MLFIIEHLEPKLSEWLRVEYLHAARIVGKNNLLLTNVKKTKEFQKIKRIAQVERRRVKELFNQKELVVLDPRARKKLSPADMRGKRSIVIGGILGEEPPLGRTRKLLTASLPRALPRNLGKHQFAIDGAVYMAKRVLEGKRLEEVPVQRGLEIQISEVYSTFLPYASPLVKGKPLVSSELVDYLKRT